MDMNVEQLLEKVLSGFQEIDYIRTGDVPGIDLYMDQVTTFMDSKLKNTTRNPEEDKILTKTMINNYAKSDLLPPPVKKKYTKEHLLVMTFIYYFKSVMSIGDIEVILNPITERYFGKSGMCMKDIYSEVLKLEMPQLAKLEADVREKCMIAADSFEDAADCDKNFLQIFSLISMLSMDVFAKKLLIERMVDELMQMNAKVEAKKETKAEKSEAKKETKTEKSEAKKETKTETKTEKPD